MLKEEFFIKRGDKEGMYELINELDVKHLI